MSNRFNFDNLTEDCITVKTSNGKSKPQPERVLPPPAPKGPRVIRWGDGKKKTVEPRNPAGAAIDRAIDEPSNGGEEKPVEPKDIDDGKEAPLLADGLLQSKAANGNGSGSKKKPVEPSEPFEDCDGNIDLAKSAWNRLPQWVDQQIANLQEECLPAGVGTGGSLASFAGTSAQPEVVATSPPEKPWVWVLGGVNEREAKFINKARYYKLTGTGQAERFVAEHKGLISYCYGRKCWYIWTGKVWQGTHNGEIYKLAKETAKRLFDVCKIIDDLDERKSYSQRANYLNTRGGLDEMLYLAQSEVAVDINDLDADPYVANAQNGIVNLRTGELQPHDPAKLCSRILACDYDPNATSEFFDKFIEGFTVGDNEVAAFIQRAMGCTLFGDAREKAFFFFYGEPDAQKSTFSNLFLKMFGGYGESAAPETWLITKNMGGNRGDLVRLAGARYVCSSEFPDGSKFNTSLLKEVTGGVPITAAAKYECEVSFQPKFGLWLDANDCPKVRGSDEGLWRRLRRIPCLGVIPKSRQDVNFKERLQAPEVLRAALAWAVRGCIEWQKHGLGSCEAVDASVEEYRIEVSGLEEFWNHVAPSKAITRSPVLNSAKHIRAGATAIAARRKATRPWPQHSKSAIALREKSKVCAAGMGSRSPSRYPPGHDGTLGTPFSETPLKRLLERVLENGVL